MHIGEIAHIGRWIDAEITGKRIIKLYNGLLAVIQANTQGNQPKQPFDDQRKALKKALEEVRLIDLNVEQLQVLEKLGIGQFLGTQGSTYLDDVLYRHNLDIATAATRLQDAVAKLTAATQKAAHLKEGLSGIADLPSEPQNEPLLRVTFQHGASISNVVELRKWANAWHDIGRGIAGAHNLPPEEIRVVGASRGSLIIELATAYVVVKTASAIVLEVLKISEKVLDIRRKAEEVRALQIDNAVREMELVASSIQQQGIEDITSQTMAKLNLRGTADGEKAAQLQKAVKSLINFVTKGGHIDYVLPPTVRPTSGGADDENVRAELLQIFSEIRSLESKLARLEYRPNGADESGESPSQ